MIPGKDGQVLKPARETDGPTELGRHLEEALRCLESTDLYGANAALKKVHDEAALARDTAGHEGATPGSRRNEERA